MKRFELLTPSSQTICATKLRYIPKIIESAWRGYASVAERQGRSLAMAKPTPRFAVPNHSGSVPVQAPHQSRSDKDVAGVDYIVRYVRWRSLAKPYIARQGEATPCEPNGRMMRDYVMLTSFLP